VNNYFSTLDLAAASAEPVEAEYASDPLLAAEVELAPEAGVESEVESSGEPAAEESSEAAPEAAAEGDHPTGHDSGAEQEQSGEDHPGEADPANK